ncbi:MAG: DUF1707 domain-containing protein [Propionibacteriaceae bacterium]|nr:DUF1707 domain-containing protein [Propionibacteriaceae bacterium]
MSELRASFPERDAYLDRLAQHYADGLLDDAGFELRRDLLLQATSHGEMLRAFDGLPKPRYRDGTKVRITEGRMGRRGLVFGGAAAFVGVVAAIAAGGALARPYQYVPPAETWAPDPMPTEATATPAAGVMPFDYGAIDEVFMTLQERGLTLITALTVDGSGVAGVAMSPRAQGELRTFSKQGQRPVIVSEAVDGELPPSVDLESLQMLMYQVPDQAMADLGFPEGFPDKVTLVFTERGTPTVLVQVLDPVGTGLGSAQYDMDGNLMALEANQ